MGFTRITEEDIKNKGVSGLPDTPNLSVADMQAKFDELAKEVIVPKFNQLVDELETNSAVTGESISELTKADEENAQAISKNQETIDVHTLVLEEYGNAIIENKSRIESCEENIEDLKTAQGNAETRIEKVEETVNGFSQFGVPTIDNSAIGEEIQLTDSTDNKVTAFAILGNASQVQYSGKSLLPVSLADGTTYHSITATVTDEGVVSLNGKNDSDTYAVWFPIFGTADTVDAGLPNGKYIVSLGNPVLSGTNVRLSFTDGTYSIKALMTSDLEVEFEVTDEKKLGVVWLTITKSLDVSGMVYHPMIRLVSVTDNTWEPYTDGVTVPNPDNRKDIVVAGGSGSVDLDGDSLIPYPYYETNHIDNGITWTDLGDGRVRGNGTATANSDYFLVSYNAMVTLEAGTYFVNGCPSGGGESTHSVIVGKKVDGVLTRIALSDENGTKFTLEEDTEIYVLCRVNAGKTVSNLIFSPTIHLIKYAIKVTSAGKNRIDSNSSRGFIRSSGIYENDTLILTKTEAGRSYYFKDYENLETGKTYTVSAKCDTTDSKGGLVYAMLYVRNEDGTAAYETLHSVYGSNIVYTFTVTKQVEKVRINFALGNDSAGVGTTITISEMQLEEGAKTEYEPYNAPVVSNLHTGELVKLKVNTDGTLIDDNGTNWIADEFIKNANGNGQKIQRILKLVLNGSEPWALVNNNTFLFRADNLRRKLAYPLCDCYLANTNSLATMPDKSIKQDFYTAEEIGFIAIKDTAYATVDEFKAGLSANNVTCYALLKNPIITDLTAEQIAEIEKVCTFYPTTQITNDAGCVMKVAYKADAKNYIDTVLLDRVTTLETALLNNI